MAEPKEKSDEVVRSQLEEVEHLLEEGDRKIEMMISSIPNALAFFADADGKIVFANGLASEALGASPKEAIGKTYAELTGAEEAVVSTLLGRIGKVLDKNENLLIPNDTFVGSDGYKKTVRTHMSAMGYKGQKAVLVMAMILDEPQGGGDSGDDAAAPAKSSQEARAKGDSPDAEAEARAAKKARVAEPEAEEAKSEEKSAEKAESEQ